MNKNKISLILNLIIFLIVTIGTVCMVCKITFMGDYAILSDSNANALKFFTVDSNILMGIIAIVFAYYQCLVISKKKKEIPQVMYTLKLMATVGVTLTFIVTTCYLAPFSEYNYFDFFTNSNLFFHFLVPVLSVITYVFFENTKDNKINSTIIGIIPMLIYSVFYVTNYLVNRGNGPVKEYDWYGFMGKGIIGSIITVILMILITYLISYTLWILNKKLYSKK